MKETYTSLIINQLINFTCYCRGDPQSQHCGGASIPLPPRFRRLCFFYNQGRSREFATGTKQRV